MKISVDDNRKIIFKEAHNGIEFISKTGQTLSVREFDGEYEIRLNNVLHITHGTEIISLEKTLDYTIGNLK